MHRRNRLTSPREYSKVFRSGARARVDGLLCVAAPAEPGEPTRIGIVAGKRVGGAVQRNRVKRLLREAARDALPHIQPGRSVVVVADPTVAGKLYQEVAANLASALRKAGAAC